MKKLISMVMCVSLSVAVAKDLNIKELENMYYTMGYEACKKDMQKEVKKAYLEGYKQGLKDAKKYLENYLMKILSYEVGKYMVKKKLITYPQVLEVVKDGEAKLIIIPPHVEDIKSLEEVLNEGKIFPIYIIKNGDIKLSNINKAELEK